VFIFQRSLTREFTSIGVSVISVLVAIIVTHQLIRLLGRAASGAVEPEAVVALIGFALLAYLPVLLALALFISVLLALSRSYRDSEMSVWFSSGLSIVAWVRPVLTFGVPIALVTALLSTVLTPWAFREAGEYERQLRSKDDVARIAPGSFIEARGSNRVFFVDNSSTAEGVVNNVFVQYNQNNRFGVVVAAQGRTEIAPNGDKFLVLSDGRRYEGTPGAVDFRIIDFETQKLRIEAREEKAGALSNSQLSTLTLINEPTPERLAELHWRLGLPLAAVILSLLAIPLSFVNPRSGTSWNGVFAVLVFFIYYNLLSVFQGWTAQGHIPVWVGLTPVHIGMVLVLGGLFSRQLFGFRRFGLGRR
jgi:lipopolysaccharide export system permease protein